MFSGSLLQRRSDPLFCNPSGELERAAVIDGSTDETHLLKIDA